ncbi:MAG: hypothetical protein QM664_11155 [Flavihumibacter sp.]
MKKLFFCLALMSAGKAIHAQTSGPVFKVPSNHSYAQKIRIDLGKGNSVTVFLSDMSDLPRLGNLDSMIHHCLIDLAPLKDSMRDPVARYYVDHFSDALGTRKISLRRTPDTDNSYLVMNGELAAIKQKQDTVRLLGIIPHPSPARHSNGERYYEFIFSVNNVDDLQQVQAADITDRLKFYAANKNDKWRRNSNDGLAWKLAKDNNITADRPTGGAYNSRDYLMLTGGVSVQNYKNYFAPGLTLGVQVVVGNQPLTWMHTVSLSWDPVFLFAQNQEGKLQTYRNDFITLGYGQRPIEEKNTLKETSFTGVGSLSWLFHRQGDFIEKNTFRFSLGRFSWKKTQIDPVIYFHDFFRGTTPGLRIVQTF